MGTCAFSYRTRRRDDPPPTPPLEFYECGICDHLHPTNWSGDCRDDANRFLPDSGSEPDPGTQEVPADAKIISWEDMQARDEPR